SALPCGDEISNKSRAMPAQNCYARLASREQRKSWRRQASNSVAIVWHSRCWVVFLLMHMTEIYGCARKWPSTCLVTRVRDLTHAEFWDPTRRGLVKGRRSLSSACWVFLTVP